MQYGILIFIFSLTFGQNEIDFQILADSMSNPAVKECKIQGSNNQYLLIGCAQHDFLVGNQILEQGVSNEQKTAISLDFQQKSQLTNNFLVQLIKRSASNQTEDSYILRATFLLFGYVNETGFIFDFNIPQSPIQFIDFQTTIIDGLENMISALVQRPSTNEIIINSWQLSPFKNKKLPSENINSETSEHVTGFHQWFNRKRNTIVWIIGLQSRIILCEYEYKTKFKYQVHTSSIKGLENYLLLQQAEMQILYYLTPVTYELIMLYQFENGEARMEKIEGDEKIDIVILLNTGNLSKLYHGYRSNSIQMPIKIQELATFTDYQSTYFSVNKKILFFLKVREDRFSFQPACLYGKSAESNEQDSLINCKSESAKRCQVYELPDFESLYRQLESYEMRNLCSINCDYLQQSPNPESSAFQFCSASMCKPFDPNLQMFHEYAVLQQISLLNKTDQNFSDIFCKRFNQTIFEARLEQSQHYTENQALKLLKQNNSLICDIECTKLYPQLATELNEMGLSLVKYENECFIEQLKPLLMEYCLPFKTCGKCQQERKCSWDETRRVCNQETSIAKIDTSSTEESSKWYLQKRLQCQVVRQCIYNQTLFQEQESLNYPNLILKAGQICTWFFQLDEIAFYRLYIQTNENQPEAEVNICLGMSAKYLCEQNQSATGFVGGSYNFTAFYFRYSVQFAQDINLTNFNITVRYIQPTSMIERLKQTLIQLLIYILCGIMMILTICYIARRRIQHLVGQAFEQEYELHQNQLLPLNTERLEEVLTGLQAQEVLYKHTSDDSLMLFGEMNCSFCLENYDSSQFVAQLFCGHMFHYTCFEQWIRHKGTLEKCPVCNQKVDTFLANRDEIASLKSKAVMNQPSSN